MQALLNLTKQRTWCEFSGSIFGLLGAFLLPCRFLDLSWVCILFNLKSFLYPVFVK